MKIGVVRMKERGRKESVPFQISAPLRENAGWSQIPRASTSGVLIPQQWTTINIHWDVQTIYDVYWTPYVEVRGCERERGRAI